LNTDSSTKTYTYTYDALNRITGATDNTGNYNLDLVEYDKNGNITKLKRQGHLNTGATNFGTMDDLTYSYDAGNKLMKVADAASIDQFGFKDDAVGTTADTSDDYSYDTNGNFLSDTNKGITSILYNHLNLPTEIKFNNSNTKKINYTYDATGIKLKKVVNDNGVVTTTDYANGYVYENNTLKFFPTKEGYVTKTGNTFKYVYQYKDHLGSIRLSYSDSDGNGTISQSEIVEEKNYYPFGMLQKGYNANVNGVHHKYDYLGQERQEELELNLISFKWRNGDPALGRFFGVDPIAESFYYMTPYQFASNNPIWKIELEGLEGIKSQEFDANGNFKNHVVEKNVVVLTKKPVEIKSNFSDKKKARLVKRNGRIVKRNTSRVNKVKSALNKTFSNTKNTKGESVKFKFNVTALQVDDTSGSNINEVTKIADANALTSESTGTSVRAAVITTGKPRGDTIGIAGQTSRNFKITFNSFGIPVISHEVGHTLLVRANEHSIRGLMTPKTTNQSRITSGEVDNFLEDAEN
jgi:RHS repeat-associated protein